MVYCSIQRKAKKTKKKSHFTHQLISNFLRKSIIFDIILQLVISNGAVAIPRRVFRLFQRSKIVKQLAKSMPLHDIQTKVSVYVLYLQNTILLGGERQMQMQSNRCTFDWVNMEKYAKPSFTIMIYIPMKK